MLSIFCRNDSVPLHDDGVNEVESPVFSSTTTNDAQQSTQYFDPMFLLNRSFRISAQLSQRVDRRESQSGIRRFDGGKDEGDNSREVLDYFGCATFGDCCEGGEG